MATLEIRLSDTERDYIEHAAKLSHCTVRQFLVKAINRRLTELGVDAVLLRGEKGATGEGTR